MNLTRLTILGLFAISLPLCSYARRVHNQVAMSTNKIHTHRIKKTHSDPYGFGGKLAKSKDHKFHPVKQHY